MAPPAIVLRAANSCLILNTRLMSSRSMIPLATLALFAAAGCSRTAQAPASASPAPARTGRAASAPAASVPSSTPAFTSSSSEDVITRTNAERSRAKLPPLTRSANLMHAAQMQADQMARANKLEHDLPGAVHPTLASRLVAVQYVMRAAGENIGEGYRSSAAAVAGWMASAGHRANILSTSYTEMGAGVTVAPGGAVYWVQVFGRPR